MSSAKNYIASFSRLNISWMATEEEYYKIPAKYRNLENLHIVFWLIKDLCWVMLWRPLGLVMIVPTIGAAVLITWQNRMMAKELYHNLAVVFWIFANAYWMITEFFWEDESLRYYAVIPFSLGMLSIGFYYFRVFFGRR
jgi:hypothetical protein